MKIWEHKPPGTLLATPGLLREPCTFTYVCGVVVKQCALTYTIFHQNGDKLFLKIKNKQTFEVVYN